jgi:hypothetical protein
VVDLDERVEVAVTDLAVVISNAVCGHEEELERELRGRHCEGIRAEQMVVDITLVRRVDNLFIMLLEPD